MRKIVTFGELITFSAGTNMTRLSLDIPDDSIYTLEDFDRDLSSSTIERFDKDVFGNKGKSVISSAGDVVISMTRSQAAIVSLENEIMNEWTNTEQEQYIALTERYLVKFKESLVKLENRLE